MPCHVAGICNQTLIVNLSGSPTPVSGGSGLIVSGQLLADITFEVLLAIQAGFTQPEA